MMRLVSTALFILCAATLPAQRHLTLREAIDMARRNSVDAAVALNELRTAWWEYRTFRADQLPEVTFQGTVPSYMKQYSSYQLDDGSYTFVHNNNLGISGTISLAQNIALTGGTIALRTSLDFMRQLKPDPFNRYMSVPVALTLSQPVFGVNTFKWDRRIEPVRYREAQARFLEASEKVAMQAITYYFNLLGAEAQLAICRQNADNSERLFEIAKRKRVMGKISKNDSLQMNLNLLNAKAALTTARSELKNAMFTLQNFLDLDDSEEISVEVPAELQLDHVDYNEAWAYADAHNAFALNIRRRQLEADYEIAKAKGAMRQISVFAQIGYTGTGASFDDSYNPLKDNQVVQVGFSIPLLDWGRRKAKVRVAQSNREVVESRLRQETSEFKQDLYLLVERFNNQKEQVALAAKADEIASTRYRTNVETYVRGRISTLDLNDSQVKKDEARSDYLQQLYLYWYYYYRLRSLTLRDFQTGLDIEADFRAFLQ